MKKTLIYFNAAAALLLAACAGVPQSQQAWQPQQAWPYFEASGRLGVKVEQKGSYANFDWLRQNGVETVDINTPLGNTVGQLCQDSEGVLAVDGNGQVFQAASAEELSRRLLGYELPVQYLGVWANGEWVAALPHRIEADGTLVQAGWRIVRGVGEDGAVRSLELTNERLNLRMVFQDSKRDKQTAAAQERCAARSGA